MSRSTRVWLCSKWGPIGSQSRVADFVRPTPAPPSIVTGKRSAKLEGRDAKLICCVHNVSKTVGKPPARKPAHGVRPSSASSLNAGESKVDGFLSGHMIAAHVRLS